MILRRDKNNQIRRIFQADERGDISGYIIAPSTVYGVGGGPVRKISSQVPNMIRAAVRRKQTVYVGEGTNRWMNVRRVLLGRGAVETDITIRYISTTFRIYTS